MGLLEATHLYHLIILIFFLLYPNQVEKKFLQFDSPQESHFCYGIILICRVNRVIIHRH